MLKLQSTFGDFLSQIKNVEIAAKAFAVWFFSISTSKITLWPQFLAKASGYSSGKAMVVGMMTVMEFHSKAWEIQ